MSRRERWQIQRIIMWFKKKTWVIAFLSMSASIFRVIFFRSWQSCVDTFLKFALRAVLERRKHELYRHCVLLFCVHLVMSIRCGSFRMLLLLAKAETKGQNCFTFSLHFLWFVCIVCLRSCNYALPNSKFFTDRKKVRNFSCAAKMFNTRKSDPFVKNYSCITLWSRIVSRLFDCPT